MYTLEMKRAFHSITPPPNFGVQLIEHNVEGMFFIEIVADEKKFIRLLDEEKRGAVEYMVRVKDALERNGAIVQVTRKAID
jgi:hypothetical protein